MHFERIALREVGPLQEFVLEPPATGLTFVVGANGAGKTTAVGAALLAIAGVAQDWAHSVPGGNAARIDVDLCDGGTRGRRTVTVAAGGDAPLRFETQGDASIFDRLTSVSGDVAFPRLVLSLDRAIPMSRDVFSEHVAALPYDIPHRGLLSSWTAERRPRSAGANVIAELVRRQSSVLNLPLLLDEPFGALDREAGEVVEDLLAYISQRSQIVVFTTSHRTRAAASATLVPGGRDRVGALSISADFARVYAGWSVTVDVARHLKVEHRAELGADDLLKELQEFRAEARAANTAVQEQLTAVQHGLTDIQRTLLEVLAAVEQIGEDLAPDLLEPETRDDSLAVSRICSEIADRAGRLMRAKAEQAAIEQRFRELRDQLGEFWHSLHAVTQRDLAVAADLRAQRFEAFVHLAVLSVCRDRARDTSKRVRANARTCCCDGSG